MATEIVRNFAYTRGTRIAIIFEGAATDDFTGYSGTMRIKKHADQATADATATITVPYTQDYNYLAVFPQSQTASVAPGRFEYDVMLTPPGGEPEVHARGEFHLRDGISGT